VIEIPGIGVLESLPVAPFPVTDEVRVQGARPADAAFEERERERREAPCPAGVTA
jgi:hypothetical protein